MSLFGTFDTMQLTDVIQWILESKATGLLTITVDMEETNLAFAQGDLSALSGESLRLDLGNYLLRRGEITEPQLAHLLSSKSEVGSVKARIVSAGMLDYTSLVKCEHEYALEILLDLFFYTEGCFHFSNTRNKENLLDEKHDFARLEKPISTRNALMDVMRRIDEWDRIKDTFPSNLTVVSALGDSEDFVHKSLMEMATPIAIGDLCVQMSLGRFTVYQRLYDLNKKGKLKIDRMNPARADHDAVGSVKELVENARVLVVERQFEEARELLATILNLEPENREARDLFRDLREQQLTYLYEQIPPHKTPILTISAERLKQMPLSHKEIFLGGRLYGKWDVGMLVVATSLGELDTLRVLRKLLHAGLAKLQ